MLVVYVHTLRGYTCLYVLYYENWKKKVVNVSI